MSEDFYCEEVSYCDDTEKTYPVTYYFRREYYPLN